jgi:hypothetical protein
MDSMRKNKKPAQPRETVVFDRVPYRDKLCLDLDVAIVTAYERGVTASDVIEQLFLHAEREAILARERNEDLSHLSAVLFGEEEAA